MTERSVLGVLAAWWVAFCPALCSAQDKLVVVTPGFDHPVSVIASRVLPEAYKKAGYELEFKVVPSRRADAMFNDGSVDGYLMADAVFPQTHPGAVMVKSPVGSEDVVVFTKKDGVKVQGWESLKPYLIGYHLGMVLVEKNIKGMRADGSEDPFVVFRKLSDDRFDLAVMPRDMGRMVLRKLNLKGILHLEPPLEKFPLYHFVTAKRADLAPKLAAALADMEKSGRLQQISEEVRAEFQK